MEKKLCLVDAAYTAPICVEEQADLGVQKIAQVLAKDMELVAGKAVQVVISDSFQEKIDCQRPFIFAGTLGKSQYIQELISKGAISVQDIEGKREVYGLFFVENQLVVVGSDKLGSIYGIFAISEAIGVSPMVDLGDAVPNHKDSIVVGEEILKISREPSVKYRGFFINDEWPCFGNWCLKHYGGINAKMYENIFIYLLRMKGNYLWPAMWASSFPVDGPGTLNEELATIYGITVAYSHHEPCLRASEEWDMVRGENSKYGNAWNFYTNKEGLTNYWEDGLKRSGQYSHMVTIGMRGERDSSMLGDHATLKDNIDLLKDVITTQMDLIQKHVNPDLTKVPMLLALYKEVEAYFYGDENTEGLKYWDKLDDVIFMLCEDNFGHMRTLPTEDIRGHKGGFGMYYHFDYHGGPVSYEWMPSTTMALTWEQMTQAYEYGIQDVWVVNVGDLKGNEVALEYFLTLAYDYDTWGSSAPNSWKEYLKLWAKRVFPDITQELQQQAADIYKDFVALNAKRRPEALNSTIYHPCHHGEAEYILRLCDEIEQKNEAFYEALNDTEKLAAFSMITYPARTSINLIRMQVYAGRNAHYAAQGRKHANAYGRLMRECIQRDRELTESFRVFRDGKWEGMELEEHIGFTKWNDDGWRYPVEMTVTPVTKPRMSVSRADEAPLYVKNYGSYMTIMADDFLDMGTNYIDIEIANDGIGSLEYEIFASEGEIPEWIELSQTKGVVEDLERVTISIDRKKLADAICRECGHDEDNCKSQKVVSQTLLVSDKTTTVAIQLQAKNTLTNGFEPYVFLPGKNGGVTIHANHYQKKHDTAAGSFTLLEEHGRSDVGMKVLPCTARFTMEQDKPSMTYAFMAEKGQYTLELWTSPANLLKNKEAMCITIAVNDDKEQVVEILPATYRGGDFNDPMWSQAVMNQIHKTRLPISVEGGINHVTIGALTPGMVLEKIHIYMAGKEPKSSYLGPKESFYTE